MTGIRTYQAPYFPNWLRAAAPRCTVAGIEGPTIALFGAPTDGPSLGNPEGALPSELRECAPGSVVTGFDAVFGALVDRLALTCAPLGSNGSIGPPTSLPPAGGTGGSVSATASCLPAVGSGLVGRTGDDLDQLALQCTSITGAGITDERFGAAVDVVGDRMVVSAPAANAGATDAGLVRVLQRSGPGSPWAVTANIVSPSPEPLGAFGDAVALSPDGTRIAVGESDRLVDPSEPGRVFLFELQEGSWGLLAGPVSAGDGADGFGASLSWAGNDRLVIGAPFAGGTGAVYDYVVGGALTPVPLASFGASAGDELGFSVAVDARPEGGHRLIVGAPGWTGFNGEGDLFPDIGAVYIFDDVDGTGFVQRNVAVTSPLGPPVRLGESVAVSGNRWAAGSSGGADITGTLFRTEDGGVNWIGETTVSIPKAVGTPSLANRYVAVEGGTLALGVPGEGGSVALFRTNGSLEFGAWPDEPTVTLQPAGVDPGDLFGWAVALDRDTLVAGAPSDDGPANTTLEGGAVYSATVPVVATFTGASSSAWTNSGNWDVDVVPGVGDFAIVPSGQTATLGDQNAWVGQVRVGGEVVVSDFADLTIDGSYDGSSIIDATGLLRILASSQMRLTGEFVVESGGQVSTQEDIGSGPGTVLVQGELNIGGGGLIANSGLVQKIGEGALVVQASIDWNSGPTSRLAVSEGDANVFTPQFDAQGELAVGPGSTLRLEGGNLDLAPTSRLGFGIGGPSSVATSYGRIVLPTGYVLPDGAVAIEFYGEYDVDPTDSYPVITCLALNCNDGGGAFTAYDTFTGTNVLDMVRSFDGWTLEIVDNKVTAGATGRAGFGFDVAVDGDWAVVGETTAVPDSPGRAYVMRRDALSGAWDVVQLLGGDSGNFGRAVDIDGDRIVVAAWNPDGSAFGRYFVYQRIAEPGPDGPFFELVYSNAGGRGAVAVTGDTVFAGRPELAPPRVDVARLSAAGAPLDFAQLNPAGDGGPAFGGFGQAIDVVRTGPTEAVAVVGAPNALTQQGRAYVFEQTAGAWTLTDNLASPDTGPTDRFFGNAVAVSDDTLVIGQWFNSTPTGDAGAVFVYGGQPGSYGPPQKLQASNITAADTFGSAVGIDGDVIVVGAGAAQKSNFPLRDGAAYVFERAGVTWTEREILRAPDGFDQERFGDALAISSDNLLVGAPSDTNANSVRAGAVYSYDVTQPAVPLVAVDDDVVTAVGTTVTIDVTENDLGGTPEQVFIGEFTPSDAIGTLTTCELDRLCTFSAESVGIYTFTYTLEDGANGETATATVTVEVRETFGGPDFAFPSLDGVINPGEWPSNERIEFTYDTGEGLAPATMYVANDTQYLYAGFQFSGPVPDLVLVEHAGTERFGIERVAGEFGGRFSTGVEDFAVDDAGGIVEMRRLLDTGEEGGVVINLSDFVTFRVLTGPDDVSSSIPDAGSSADVQWFVTAGAPIEPPGSVSGVTANVFGSSGNVTIGGFAVALADVPVDQLIAGAEAIAGTPLQSVDLEASPLGSIPLRSIPLRSIAASATTLLSEVKIDGGWAPLLAGTPLEGRPLQTITLAAALDAVPPERLNELSLADLTTTGTAVGALDVAELLLGADVISDATGGVAGAPLGSIPLGSIPLRSIPLGSIPLRSIPLGSIPLGSIPLGSIPLGSIPLRSIGDLAAAPLGSIPLGSIPLGSIPLGSIPLGSIPLGSIPLGSIPLRSIDLAGTNATDFCEFHDADPQTESCAALGIDPDTTTVSDYVRILGVAGLADTPLRSIPLGSIPLGSIPLGSIPLGSIPLGSIPLGSIPLRSIPLGSVPLRSIPLGSIELDGVCASLNLGAGCTLPDIGLADYLDQANVATLEASPLGSIPLASIPLGSIPLRSIPLRSIDIAGVPLRSIPLRSIDLLASPLGSIPLGSIPLGSIPTNSPLGSIPADTPLRSIPIELLDGLTIVDLVDYLEDPNDPTNVAYTLADILDHLTLAFFAELGPEFTRLTFGEVIVALLLAGDFPWEDLPLDDVDLRGPACGPFDLDGFRCEGTTGAPDNAVVDTQFTVSGGRVTGAQLRFAAPADWVPAPDGAYVGNGPDFWGYETLRRDGGDWVMDLPPLEPANYSATVALLPSLRLGTADISNVRIVNGADVQVGLPGTTALNVASPAPASSAAAPRAIQPDALYLGYIDQPGREDWYAIAPPGPGFRVAVYLSNLDGDIDTFVYRPDTAPLGDPDAVRDVPLGSTPVEDEGVDVSGTGSLSPEVLADAPIDESLTLAATSTNRGSSTEEAVFFSRAGDVGGDPYVIQVAGYNRSTSTSPYVLRVRYEPVVAAAELDDCPARLAVSPLSATGLPPVVPVGTNTLLLTNPQRLADLYGTDAAQVASALDALVDSSLVDAAVVDIADIPGVADAFDAWDAVPCSPVLANNIAGPIQAWIQQTVGADPSIRHVAVIGSDEVIPFARLQDSTVVANESTYIDDFELGSALRGAHSSRTYLSDTPYGDLGPVPWLDRYAYLPDLGVGRLVETPGQIVGAIQTFIDNQGVLSPETAAVAGYDFLEDGAEVVKKNLASIVDAQGFSTITDVDPSGALLAENWTRELLGEIGFGPVGGTTELPDIISPNAHYDHYRLLPALGDLTDDESALFTIDDIGDQVTSGELARRIVFTMGCHAGLNVPGGTATDPAVDEDWAEVYGAARAIYIGNTGYGYGDTATVALTEQLMANFAFRLDGDLTVGQALAQAKQDQFGKAGIYGVYDLKAIEQSTLYGLPMWEIDGPGREEGASPISVPASEPITGLQAASFSVEPDFEEQDVPGVGSFWTASGETQFLHWRPIQPKTSIDVTQDGLLATGVLLTDLTSTDIGVVDAAFGRPQTTSASVRQPEIETEGVVFPSAFATLGTSSRLNTGAGPPAVNQQNVNLIPGQYNGAGATPFQRLFERVDGLVHYVSAGSAGDVDWTPPRILSTTATTTEDAQVVFEVEATDAESGVDRVVVLYRASSFADGRSGWRAIDLNRQDTTDRWVGVGTFGAISPPLDYIVQAVNGDGVVGVSTSKGELFRTEATPPDDPDPIPPDVVLGVLCNGEPCTLQTYDGPVTIVVPEGDISVDGGDPIPNTVTITAPGFHVVVVQKGTATTTFGVTIAGDPAPVDETPPTVTITSPADGATFDEGDVVLAQYECADDVGVASCDGPVAVEAPIDTSSPGTVVFEVTAVDTSGNTTTESVTYTVVDTAITFEGFFPPLASDPDPTAPTIRNVVTGAQTVPVRWRLYAPDGSLITSTAGINVGINIVPCAVVGSSGGAAVVDPAPSVGNGLRFTGGQFQFSLKTNRSWRGSCGILRVTFGDGQFASALFQFR